MKKLTHLPLILSGFLLLSGCEKKPSPITYEAGAAKIQAASQAEAMITRAQEAVTTTSNIEGFIGQGMLGTTITFKQEGVLAYHYIDTKKYYQENDTCNIKVGSEKIADYQDETYVYHEINGNGYSDYTLSPHAKPTVATSNKMQEVVDVTERRNTFLATIFLSDFPTFYENLNSEMSYLNEVGALSFTSKGGETELKLTLDNQKVAAYRQIRDNPLLDLEMDLGEEIDFSKMSFEITDYNFATCEITLILDQENRGYYLSSHVVGSVDVRYTSEPGANPLLPEGINLAGTIEFDVLGEYRRSHFDKDFPITMPDDLGDYATYIVSY